MEEEFHDEIEIEDFEYDENNEVFKYPCPCGDLFVISKDDLINGEDVAKCPTCSLMVKVIYQREDLEKYFPIPLKQSRPALMTTK
ncbi:diphthamide biosynthesis 3 [Brevipalpus obovatus]|uniref:diphthamide biosynthesis 3 n=1 Tax=Brevipalpus obovatus TaxID=246614 RepID=UPI003D9E2E95